MCIFVWLCVCVCGKHRGHVYYKSPQFHTCLILSEFGVNGFVVGCVCVLGGVK